jgi:intraflagellar transport protein 172
MASYLKGFFSRLMLKNPKSLHNRDLIKDLTLSLLEREFYEDAGEIFEATGQVSKALEAFRMGKFFDKAVKLAKGSMQHEVVPLEEEWGDHLVSLKQFDAASNHFIEAGSVLKALEAAIEARQFKKAAQIIVVSYFHLGENPYFDFKFKMYFNSVTGRL